MEDPDRNPAPARVPRAAQRPRLTLPGMTGARLAILGAVVGLIWIVTAALIGRHINTRLGMAPADPPAQLLEKIGPQPAGSVNILLLGKDERPDEIRAGSPGRTDTIMVLRVDFDQGRAKLLSIPRDMTVALPHLEAHGITAGKINTAYHYGELYDMPGGGPQAAMDTVALNLGIPLDHYILIDFQGFVSAVDALGGIDVDVPEAIRDHRFPTDDYGVMTFSVEAGRQHMDGLTALRYARTRSQDNDIERIRRQQLILLAIRDKMLSAHAFGRTPEIYDAIAGAFETDMSLATLIAYGLAGVQSSRSQIATYILDNATIDSWSTVPETRLLIPRRPEIAPLIAAFMADK